MTEQYWSLSEMFEGDTKQTCSEWCRYSLYLPSKGAFLFLPGIELYLSLFSLLQPPPYMGNGMNPGGYVAGGGMHSPSGHSHGNQKVTWTGMKASPPIFCWSEDTSDVEILYHTITRWTRFTLGWAGTCPRLVSGGRQTRKASFQAKAAFRSIEAK